MSAFIWRDRLALIGIPIRLALAIITLLVADMQQAPLHILALTLIVAIGSLIATLGVVTDRWGVLIADGIVLAVLLNVTGGVTSPLLMCAVVPVVLGMTHGEPRDVLIGAGIGAALALVPSLVRGALPEADAVATLGIIVVNGAAGLGLLQQRIRAAGRLAERLEAAAHDTRIVRDVENLLAWQHDARQALAAADIDSIHRAVERCGTALGAAGVGVILPGQHTPDGRLSGTRFPFTSERGRGAIIVAGERAALEPSQLLGLNQLADLTGARIAEIEQRWQASQHADIMTILWQASGMIRLAQHDDAVINDVSRRLATVLALEWLAVLTDDEGGGVAPLMLVQGSSTMLPRIHLAHLRVAGEAMRAGRQLVRNEGTAVLFCTPLEPIEGQPRVLAAYGADGHDAGAQAVLMLFGGMVNPQISRRRRRTGNAGPRQASGGMR